MTDLHCHILPGIDDGAKDTAVSLELLRREYEDGVRNIAFTSHFNSERTTVEAFTAKRQAAFEQLTAALEGQPMQFDFKLGAEVFFSPGLCELDTRALCMGDTAYLLLEFPTTHKPHFIRQTLYQLQQQHLREQSQKEQYLETVTLRSVLLVSTHVYYMDRWLQHGQRW